MKTTSQLYTFKFNKILSSTILPGSPVTRYRLVPQISDLSEVAEGKSVNLTCTAAVPCPHRPPNITWSLPTGNITPQIWHTDDGAKSLLSVLTFTASRHQHEGEIFCMASYLRQEQKNIVKKKSTVRKLRVFCKNVIFTSH